jgi:uncharacterized zinc-type alcohol dehydrogenase-like protein
MSGIKTKGYGAKGSIFNSLNRMDFEREAPKEDEVHIDVLYCGVCHSDLHQVKNDWGNTVYPCVPGHEIIGKVLATGSAVTKFKVGDTVGVGCMIDSCGVCDPCQHDEESYCQGPHSFTATYNGYMKADPEVKFNTFGGYSDSLVVKESFVLRIPDSLNIEAAAPILCAGITTYSPLKRWNVQPGDSVGVLALGGLGHMAVKLASAMGAEVTVFTTDKEKVEDAIRFGAKQAIVSSDEDAMKSAEKSLDYLLVTVPDSFDLTPYISLMKLNGSIVTVGLLGEYKKPVNNMNLAMSRISISGSLIGGIADTQEVLDFCAEHNILPETKLIKIQDINDAFSDLLKKDVHYRYVIDMQSLKEEA